MTPRGQMTSLSPVLRQESGVGRGSSPLGSQRAGRWPWLRPVARGVSEAGRECVVWVPYTDRKTGQTPLLSSLMVAEPRSAQVCISVLRSPLGGLGWPWVALGTSLTPLSLQVLTVDWE